MTALVWGTPNDPSTASVLAALARRHADVTHVDVTAPHRCRVVMEVGGHVDGGILGWVEVDGLRRRFDTVTGIFARPVDPAAVPSLADLPERSSERRHARVVHDGMTAFTELLGRDLPGRVLNSPTSAAACRSLAVVARAATARGLALPSLARTDDHDGSARSEHPSARTELAWHTVQIETPEAGTGTRVLVVGDRVFAAEDAKATSHGATDARRVGGGPQLVPYVLPDEVAERCIGLAADLDLGLVGLHLVLTPSGRVVCRTVDPSPDFAPFEQMTGLPVAAAIAQQLTSAPTRRASGTR